MRELDPGAAPLAKRLLLVPNPVTLKLGQRAGEAPKLLGDISRKRTCDVFRWRSSPLEIVGARSPRASVDGETEAHEAALQSAKIRSIFETTGG